MIKFKINFEHELTLFLVLKFMLLLLLINTKKTLSLLFNEIRSEVLEHAIKV